MSIAVEMRGIGKSFGAVSALDDVSLRAEAGTIHAIVGENGAGKTTLMRVLFGALQADQGEMSVGGVAARFRSSREAIAAGVGMVSQHYGIIPELTCRQNLILGAEGGALLRPDEEKARAQRLAEQMGFRFDWNRPAAELSPAGNQKLEILKLLWREARIMILDEPTAMLSPADADALFLSLRQLTEAGATVLLVTHRLPEVMDYAQEVTVLRGGRFVAHRRVSDTNAGELAELIVGGDVVRSATGPSAARAEAALEVRDLRVRGHRRNEAVKSASFRVACGEVVGIAGVDGSGQRELMRALLGVSAVESGSVWLGGQDVTAQNAAARLSAGLRVIPEDRHAEAVIEDWSLVENSVLGLQRQPAFAATDRMGWAARVADRFRTKHGGLRQPMRSLSGGNQQRFVVARALESEPKMLLAFAPTRGLDLNGTAGIYGAIREACRGGMGALVVSFDLDELLEHCDRIVVMNGGVLTESPTKDRAAVGRLMTGAQ